VGLLIEGEWHDEWYDTKSAGGRFVRKESHFRNWVRADGSTRFAPEAGRYHLYVSYACPWAHRTLIFRKLKGLEGAITLSVVEPVMAADGWSFGDAPGSTGDTVNDARYLRDVYVKAAPRYTGRVTVPVRDRKHDTIVSNESSEIIRMVNREFDAIGNRELDFRPEELRDEIEAERPARPWNRSRMPTCCSWSSSRTMGPAWRSRASRPGSTSPWPGLRSPG
jgi:putative glutathione S-transferase